MSWLLLLVFVLRAFAIEDLQDEVDRLRCALILAISVKLKKEFKAQNGKIGALGVRICEFDVRIELLMAELEHSTTGLVRLTSRLERLTSR